MELLEKEDKAGRIGEISQEPYIDVQKYLSFKLDSEEYAIEVFEIKEVIKYTEVTGVPNVTPSIKGVISLRGVVIPVLDIKSYLGLSDSQPTLKIRIIIIGHNKTIAGLMVDSVEGVINISSDKIAPIPMFLEKERIKFSRGMIEYKDRFIMVLNTDALLNHFKNEN